MIFNYICIGNIILINQVRTQNKRQAQKMFGDDIFIDDGFGGTDIIIDNGGFFGGTDIIIDNGYGYGGGTTIIENNGFFGRSQQIIVNNGYGGTTIIEQRNGLFGPREEIIVNNNGYGGYGGTTIIEERRGLFGGREQVIVNNGPYGNTTIIEQNRGLFGGREQIIVNNGGYGRGGNTTIIEQNRGLFGGREQIIVNNGGYGGGTTTIIQNNGIFGNNEEIIVSNGNVLVCPVGCMGGCCVNRRRDMIVACPANCMGTCCLRLRQKPPAVNNRPVYAQQQTYTQSQQQTYTQSQQQTYTQPQQQTYTQPPVKQQAYQQSVNNESQILAFNMYQLKYGKWQGLKPVQLTTKHFHNYSLPLIKKLKCRTMLQPYSNQLQGGQVVMKVVIGVQDLFYAAPSKVIGQYFCHTCLIKMRRETYQEEFNGAIDGMILKKSDILGNWEERYVEISKMNGLKSYRNRSMAHTLHIPFTRQIWTWFEVIQGNYLVIKLKHNLSKMQFAIPINQKFQAWLQAFFGLLEDYN